jgi:hypothetical protein
VEKRRTQLPSDGGEVQIREMDMSELQTRFIDDTYAEYYNTGKHELAQIYLKKDVDKLIADLEESHKKEVGQLLMEIVELKKERRWRKFPEEKPKWGEEVLVVDDESKQYIVRFSHDMKWISWGKKNTCESNCVKYWMPLPKAPKEAK